MPTFVRGELELWLPPDFKRSTLKVLKAGDHIDEGSLVEAADSTECGVSREPTRRRVLALCVHDR